MYKGFTMTTSNDTQTLVIKMGYRGGAFHGFAPQPETRTVAGELERALSIFLRRDVEMTCAGRTDTGVHAQAQYVSIPISTEETKIPKYRFMHALTALTPDDIAIRDIYRAPEGFSARFDAQMRHYRYRIFSAPSRPVLTWDNAWWVKSPLNIEKMNEGAQHLVGEHDFISFCKAKSAVDKPTFRYIESIQVSEAIEMDENIIHLDVAGNAFLHSMVRTITGSLVEVGREHRDPIWMKEILDACSRTAAGPCAPACGLTFRQVDYPQGSLLDWE